MSDKNQLLNLIDDLVKQQTFSLDAIKAIDTLRAKAQSQEDELKKAADTNDRLHASMTDMYVEIDTLKNTIKRLSDDNEALQKNKADADKAIFAAIKEKAVADAYRDAMMIVFKPAVMRDSIARTVAVPMPGSTYPTMQNESETVTREEV